MQKEEVKFQASTILEGMTSLRGLFAGKESGVNNRPIYRIVYDEQKAKKPFPELGYLRAMGEKFGFETEAVSAEYIQKTAIGQSHGGILAVCGVRDLPHLGEKTTLLPENGWYAVLQGIEDPYNFGYALRSLYACGADGIILCERNWMSAAGVVARASAGASERFPVLIADPLEACDIFHAYGYRIVCADERSAALLPNTELKKPLLTVIGGERRGISRAMLEKADVTVRIPYGRPFAGALSAASATTILGYEILRQNF